MSKPKPCSQVHMPKTHDKCLQSFVYLPDKERRSRNERNPPVLTTFALPLHRGTISANTLSIYDIFLLVMTRKTVLNCPYKFLIGLVIADGCPQGPGLPLQRP